MGSRGDVGRGPRVNGQGFAMARRAALMVALTLTTAPAPADPAPASSAGAPTRAHVTFPSQVLLKG